MAEVKNTFIQSKMNQDLDARLIPNGQYRDALNVGISRSEGDDVGALENILGNVLISDFGLDDCSLECIGHWMDMDNDRIFVFLTNYSDSSTTLLANNPGGGASVGTDCYIAYYDIRANSGTIIVGGDWLNFSKTHPISGVNLIEGLLFWTDNRNQPRKINVNTAIVDPYIDSANVGYYFNEDQISVAKYYPFQPISLIEADFPPKEEDVFSTMKNVTDEWLPIHCILRIITVGGGGWIVVDGAHTLGSTEENLYGSFASGEGDRISGPNTKPDAFSENVLLQTVTAGGAGTTETLIQIKDFDATQTLYPDQCLYVQRKNPDYNQVFSGDPDFLKDKFARFSYRFKFDDGEYSLIAPFTQIAFVPLQDGYFIGDNCTEDTYDPVPTVSKNTGPGQESETYRSTIVPFMENKVDEIVLRLPAPIPYNTNTIPLNWDQVSNELKVTEIDILWKSADDQSIKVIETLKSNIFNAETTSWLSYTYNSTEPWKTLPTNTLTRASDKVPIRALAQEATGNRIIYANYIDKHTSPGALEYAVNIDEKPPLPINSSPQKPIEYNNAHYVRKEYQNHTLKQNRTYQVGVILSDRWGRQSDVILSDIEAVGGGKASTIFHPYRDIRAALITDKAYSSADPTTWPGDMLELDWTNTIPENSTRVGYPGLFSVNDGSVIGIKDIVSSGWGSTCGTWKVAFGSGPTPAGDPTSLGTIEFTSNPDGTIDESTIVILPGSYGFNNGQTVSVYDAGIIPPMCSTGFGTASFGVITPSNNNLGWYSYKIVVKQTEQDYYNCYLPGMLAGYPQDIIGAFPVIDEDPPYDVIQQGVKGVQYPTGLEGKDCHIVLMNDNINKIPRDLIEVGPDQQQFRSSVKLFGRVENYKVDMSGSGVDGSNMNKQYQPNILGDTVVVIGPMTELGLGSLTNPEGSLDNQFYAGPSDNLMDLLIPPHWYDGQSNPVIARVSTKDEIGWRMVPQTATNLKETMTPFLSVYETAPVKSKLDIYWETTTSGLISELNNLILTVDSTLPVGISDPSILISEGFPSETTCSSTFWAEGVGGVDLDAPGEGCTITLLDVTESNSAQTSVFHKFELMDEGGVLNRYSLRTKYNQFFLSYEDPTRCNLIFTFNINRSNGIDPISNTIVTATGIVTNVTPGERQYPDRTNIKSLAFLNSNIPIPAPTEVDSVPFSTGCETVYQPATYTTQPYYHTGSMYMCPVGGYFNQIDWSSGPACDYGSSPECPPASGDSYSCDFNKSQRGKGKLYGLRGTQPWSSLEPNPTVYDGKEPNIANAGFDGVFKADNGIYGSQPPPGPGLPPPVSYDTEEEILFYVARAYQVSAIFGFNEVPDFNDSGNGGGYNCVHYGATNMGNPAQGETTNDDGLCWPGCPNQEWVFGRPNIAKLEGHVAPVLAEDASLETPRVWAPGLPQHGLFIDEWVTGPTYLQHTDLTGINPTDATGPSFGEASVGQKHNSSNHYWHLNSQQKLGIGGSAPQGDWVAAGADMKTLKTPPLNSSGPWRMMRNTDGGSERMWITQLGGNPTYTYWNGTGANTDDIGTSSLFYSSMTPLEASQSFPRFVAKNLIDSSNVQKAEIWVGSGVHGMGDGEQSVIPTTWTGMPPGRYVVTLRAQDKNGNSDGLFFEWDVPVLILESNDNSKKIQYFSGTSGISWPGSSVGGGVPSGGNNAINNYSVFQCCNCSDYRTHYTSTGDECIQN